MGRQSQGMLPCSHRGLRVLLFLFALASAVVAQPEPESQGEESISCGEVGEEMEGQELGSLDLEDLLEMEIEVTSVSGTAQRFFTAPAAIHVISQDDIRRSGAQELPELFRNVPGMNVARLARGRWAISARGFNSRFANKLLVQKDGRSIYSSIFAGVIWETEDTILEDLERVEVIRGPGATVWGANAVNGIINLVTKSSHDTHGGLFKITAETDGPGSVLFRYGAAIDEDWSFRVHAKGLKRDGYPLEFGGSDEEDNWTGLRVGGRIDGSLSDQDELMLDFELARANTNALQYTAIPSFPYTGVEPAGTLMKGASFVARWRRELEDGSDLSLQFNYSHGDFSSVMDFRVDTVDIDFQHHLFAGEDHEIVWGLGYTLSSDVTSASRVLLVPASMDLHTFSAFAQDTVTLSDSFRLTFGTKLEHNQFSGFEIQPTVRMSWSPDETQTLWTAVSRAVHTPNRTDQAVVWPGFQGVPTPGGFPPTILGLEATRIRKAEDLLAVELGYRIKPHRTLLVEIATFLNFYDRLQDVRYGAPTLGLYQGVPVLNVPLELVKPGHGNAYGAELNLRWRPLDWLSVDAWYAFLDVDVNSANDSDTAPHHTAQLRLGFDPVDDLQFNTSLYYSDNVRLGEISAYLRWDVNARWRIDENFLLAAGVQNLLDDVHPEYQDYNGPIYEVRRLAWLSLEISF